MILFRCPKCGERSADLEGHKCVPAPDRLAKARAALAEAEGRKELPVEDERAREALAGVREEMRRRAAPVAKEAVLASPKAEGFDRAAYHKTYMKDYMRGWRARRKGGGGGSDVQQQS
jgi:hypothetical protein